MEKMSFLECMRSLGADAQIAESSLVNHIEKVIGVSLVGSAVLGTVDILSGPIRWVNVMRQYKMVGFSMDADAPRIFTRYGVPDPRLSPSLSAMQIKAKRKKGLLGLGGVVDLQWKGKDGGLGIINRLNSDISLKGPMMRSRGDIEIRAYRRYGCWIISHCILYEVCLPSEEIWSCYQSIARHLLAEWSSG